MVTSKKNIPVFDFNKKLDDGLLFQFTKLEESYNPYDASHPHRHNYFEVLIFNNTGGYHEIDFQNYPVEKNAIHFVSPGQVHLLRRDPKVKGYVLSFTDGFFLNKDAGELFIDTLPFFINPDSEPVVRITKKTVLKEIKEIIGRIQNEFHSSHSDKTQVIAAWMSLFLLSCKRIYTSTDHRDQGVPARSEIIRKFKKLVEENFKENKSVSEYANLLNITPGHLTDTVQKELGKSASQLIHDRIILEAKRLLYHSEKSVKEIASVLNYEDPSYFTKFFKTHSEFTPEQFRKLIREKYH